MKLSRKTDTEKLESFKLALSNAMTHPEISRSLEEHGYNSKKLEEGTLLLTEFSDAYFLCQNMRKQLANASRVFVASRDKLIKKYEIHRAKALVLLQDEVSALDKLHIDEKKPKRFSDWLTKLDLFYKNVSTDPSIMELLATLNVTSDDIEAALSEIRLVEKNRYEYMKVKGDSQNATKQKDAAAKKISDWMRRFFILTNIAVGEQVQLQEALGKVVKN